MQLQCFGSSSRGNFYMLCGADECLLIEAGIPMPQIRKAVDWSKAVGCIITHRHGDHAQSIAGVKLAGVPVFAPDDVFDYYHIPNDNPITEQQQFTVGGFMVLPFAANHDVPCFSYLIKHRECGKLLFITDSAGCEYSFTGVNNILIECNYSKDILQKKIEEGTIAPIVAKRLRITHFELEDVCDFLRTHGLLDDVKNIILLHLSGENADANKFIMRVKRTSEKPVFVAEKWFKLEL